MLTYIDENVIEVEIVAIRYSICYMKSNKYISVMKYILCPWVELPGETIEPESCVFVAGDNKGVDRASLVLKRASDAYGEYRVGLSQA